MSKNETTLTNGDLVLDVLESYGIDRIFCSPGSEWPTVWEALAKRRANGIETPVYMNCRHEELAVSAAVAYERTTGRMPAVLLHTTVGLLKASMAIRMAYKAQSPMVVFSSESSNFGEGRINAGPQFSSLSDLGGPRRLAEPFVKWAGQALSMETLEAVLGHACEIAMAPPMGPTFVTTPFEILLQNQTGVTSRRRKKKNIRFDFSPNQELIEQACNLLLESHHPIIITEYAGSNPKVVEALVELAEVYAIPVVEIMPRCMNFPRDNPLHLGFSSRPLLADADLALLVGVNQPWYPASKGPPDNAKIILFDEDPAKTRTPFWGYNTDLVIAGSLEVTLRRLVNILKSQPQKLQLGSVIEERLARCKNIHERNRANYEKSALDSSHESPMDPKWVSYVLSKVIPTDAIVVAETTSTRQFLDRILPRTEPRTFFSAATGGGLGLGFGFSLGAKVGSKERLVVGLLGDGAFNYNPIIPCFGFAQEYDAPVLLVIFDNGGYASQHAGLLQHFPQGYAVRNDIFYGTSIKPRPNYSALATAFGGYGERVENPADLETSLNRAIEKVKAGHIALVDVIMKFSDD